MATEFSGLWENLLYPNCSRKLEQFLVRPVFRGYDQRLETVNVARPHCRIGANITITELTQALVKEMTGLSG